MNSCSKIVEFVGLPGVGKSTVCDSIAERIGAHTRQSLAKNWRSNGLRHNIPYIMRATGDMRLARAAIHYATTTPLGNLDSLRRLYRSMVMREWLAVQQGRLFLDQAIMQQIFSMHFSVDQYNPSREKLAPLLGAFYRGVDATIVSLEVDPNEVARRLAGRAKGMSRLDGLQQLEQETRLGKLAPMLETLVAAAEDANIRVERVDASTPSDQVIAAVSELVS